MLKDLLEQEEARTSLRSVRREPELPVPLAGTAEQNLPEKRDITLEDVERVFGPGEVLYDGPAPCPTCARRGAGREASFGADAHGGGRT